MSNNCEFIDQEHFKSNMKSFMNTFYDKYIALILYMIIFDPPPSPTFNMLCNRLPIGIASPTNIIYMSEFQDCDYRLIRLNFGNAWIPPKSH